MVQKCKYCGQEISFIKSGASWYAMSKDGKEQHICSEYQRLFGYDVSDLIKKEPRDVANV